MRLYLYKSIVYVLYIFLISNISACKRSINPASSDYSITKSASSDTAMVASAHPLATQIGIDILKKGGNAIDAAIAVQFALAVCYPNAGNIGGGGFLVYRSHDSGYAALDYREKAPHSASADMYLDSIGNPITEASLFGPKAAGVPGTVDGMVKAFEKYSQLKDWPLLINPAINLAHNGYPITEREANALNENKEQFIKNNRWTPPFVKEASWKAGDILRQPELASVLEAIRDNGENGFYSGWVAEKIVDEMHASNGKITLEDLSTYEAIWRTPIQFFYRGYKFISMPPPSSGGIALAQLLKSIEPYPMSEMGFQSLASIHLMAEAERRVYADRSTHLGDADYYNVPQNTLLDSVYIASRMADFQPRQATKSSEISAGIIESEETTHFSIVDRFGNAASVTTTLNGSYGSYTTVKGAGFILNNEMDDFSVKPGAPNLYGLIGAEANKIEPGKRMLSSMTPTIVEQNNKLKMVVGTPGGSTIITSVFQVVVNVLDFKMSIFDAVQNPRFHHQWIPDVLFCEDDAISEETRIALQGIGHNLKQRGPIGRVEAIMIDDNGVLHGAADKRGDDDVKGY